MSPRRSSIIALAAALATAAPARAQVASLDAERNAPQTAAAPATASPAPATFSAPVPTALAPTVLAPTVLAPAGPALATAAVALQPARSSSMSLAQEEAAMQARSRGGFSQSEILMIVGGVALITGLVIGDDAGDVLAIGGAGVGLYGLYRYLQGR